MARRRSCSARAPFDPVLLGHGGRYQSRGLSCPVAGLYRPPYQCGGRGGAPTARGAALDTPASSLLAMPQMRVDGFGPHLDLIGPGDWRKRESCRWRATGC